MIINTQSLGAMFSGFNTLFNSAFGGAATFYKDVAMVVPSTGSDETYGWLNQQSGLREWLGSRVIKNLSAAGYTIKNRKFEDTVSVPRTSIEDDKIGVYGPAFAEMGRAAAEHPDQLVAELLGTGFAAECYDGQYFFDTDHPVGDGDQVPVTSVSNMQAGAGTPWFLLDTSRMVKPAIYQERIKARLTALNSETDENVFMQDDYLYGVRARSNVGFGLWQLAFGSKAALDADNYAAARKAMMEFKGDGGRPLGVRPTTLVVPPSLEEAAMGILNTELLDGGGSNVWKGTAKLIVTPWLA